VRRRALRRRATGSRQHLGNLYDKFGIGAQDSNRRSHLANQAVRRGAVSLGSWKTSRLWPRRISSPWRRRILLAVPPHPALPLVREDFFDGDDYVLAMDWVDGTDLATLLRDRRQPGLAPSSVLAYLAEAADALAHLHAQEPPVVHGDVKPANLILTTGVRAAHRVVAERSAAGLGRRRPGPGAAVRGGDPPWSRH
jgi:serine/threonine protein kinase